MAKIQDVKAREILDSRGNPTVEAEVLVKKRWFRASVPSGASTGKYEAVELRDGGKRWQGKGVLNAVEGVNFEISGRLIGFAAEQQRNIDDALIHLDDTYTKHVLGANAILAVSLACARAGAVQQGVSLFSYLSRVLCLHCNHLEALLPAWKCHRA